MTPRSQKSDDTLWAFVETQGYRVTPCAEQNTCILVSQGLNVDGHPEQVLYAFGDGESLTFGIQKNKWDLLAVAKLPEGFTKDKLLQTVANQQLGPTPRIQRDITTDGERLLTAYYTE